MNNRKYIVAQMTEIDSFLGYGGWLKIYLSIQLP